jgi:hypothetical protein
MSSITTTSTLGLLSSVFYRLFYRSGCRRSGKAWPNDDHRYCEPDPITPEPLQHQHFPAPIQFRLNSFSRPSFIPFGLSNRHVGYRDKRLLDPANQRASRFDGKIRFEAGRSVQLNLHEAHKAVGRSANNLAPASPTNLRFIFLSGHDKPDRSLVITRRMGARYIRNTSVI